jgi:hypothetical protein
MAGGVASRGRGGLRRGGPGRPGRGGWRRVAGSWPLAVVVAVQVVLSLRLVWADTAFQDEAAYLWAGHLEWAHWLHGTPVPPFAAYFSGAPVVYPPLAALADSAGGLAGARILSLCFMAGATVALWAAAGRLFGRRAGFFAVALFAVAGPVLHLGAFATYDAMAVFLVALAAWLVVRAGGGRDGTGWMLAAGAVLALANATAYASVLFDPVVIAVALLTAFPKPGGKAAVARAGTVLAAVTVLVLAGLLAGGSSYLHGVGQTTLARVAGSDPVPAVLGDAWPWTAVIVVAAVSGVVISWAGGAGRGRTWLLAVLAAAALLGPLEQARLHTAASLDKHVAAGAWFAAIAAGYAADRFIAAAPAGRNQVFTCGACVVALAFPLSLGAGQAHALSTSWADSASFTAVLGPLARPGSGHLLVEDPSIAEYYLPAGSQWERWSSTRNITLPSGASTAGPATSAGVTGAGNPGVFAEYITAGYFSLVALNFADTTPLDHAIAADLRRSHHYRITQVIPYGPHGTYVIWQHEAHWVAQSSYEPHL